MRLLAVATVAGTCVVARVGADEPVEQFEKNVAPLLATRCLGCHDAADPKGGLDLTRRATALAGGESGVPAVIPGKTDESYLLDRVVSGEMPPERKGQPLSQDEIALVTRWIEAGAAWPEERVLSPFEFTTDTRAGMDWWSLKPVDRPAPPQIESDWIRNPIDAFVLERLQAAKLSPAPPADKRTLIRRVTFDLTGLPPTPEDVEKFLADEKPDAYQRLVNRLLDSPQYGERWARHWLDVAHFADTHGFERDFRRDHAWPYRDYVIRSLNNDKPYDQFLREQIAGDVIAPNDPDAVIATGFLAAGPWDYVGHKENKDPKFKRLARADDLDDMVTTVMTASVGLTVNCARCHNHKFDPIPQADYYRLWAVFAGVERGDRHVPSSPAYDEDRRQLAEVLAELNSLDGKGVNLADIVGGGGGFGDGTRGHGIDPRSGKPVTRGETYLGGVKVNQFAKAEHPLIDGLIIPSGSSDGKTPVTISSTGIEVTELPPTNGKVWGNVTFGPSQSAVRTEIDGINYAAEPNSIIGLHANKGITFDLAAVRRTTDYRRLRLRTVVAYGGADGNFKADAWVFIDGKLAWKRLGLNNAHGAIPLDIPLAADARFLTLVATDAGNDISHDQVFFGNPLLVNDPDDTAGDSDAKSQRRVELVAKRDALQLKIKQSGTGHRVEKVYAAVKKDPPPVHILHRGDTESPRDVVAPAALSCIAQLSPELAPADSPEGQRRLALADWIVDEKNPLTPRVIVNRLWHHHFGTGIVDSPSDFGFHGGRPSHPELLDWLAAELIDSGWSLKHLHRLIVTSSAYRQSGQFNNKAAAQDADNRLLWRMTPRRLEAEAVRDAVLAVSGKLNPQMGGPGYRDFQFIDRYAPIYRYVTADKPELWRRSVYRFAVRSVPNQFMEVLDCPNPSNLAPRRSETTTALQSLALLNAPFMTQQADYFAQRVIDEAGEDVPSQVRLSYQLALAREPSEVDLDAAVAFVGEQSLFHFCRVLLNANEFMYVD